MLTTNELKDGDRVRWMGVSSPLEGVVFTTMMGEKAVRTASGLHLKAADLLSSPSAEVVPE